MAHVGQPIEIGSPEDLARRAGRLRNPIDRERADGLSKDARDSIRQLKLKHREAWRQDAREFRKLITQATSEVTRLKPGPKEDPNIAAGGTAYVEQWPDFTWESLCRKYDPLFAKAHPATRRCVVESFQRKAKRYIREHPHLRRKLDRKRASSKHRPSSPNS